MGTLPISIVHLRNIFQPIALVRNSRTCACVRLYVALIIERIDKRRVGPFRVAYVNANPKTGEPLARKPVEKLRCN